MQLKNNRCQVNLTPISLLLLHPDPSALLALPFSLSVIDVPFQFFHWKLADLAGHASMIAPAAL